MIDNFCLPQTLHSYSVSLDADALNELLGSLLCLLGGFYQYRRLERRRELGWGIYLTGSSQQNCSGLAAMLYEAEQLLIGILGYRSFSLCPWLFTVGLVTAPSLPSLTTPIFLWISSIRSTLLVNSFHLHSSW